MDNFLLNSKVVVTTGDVIMSCSWERRAGVHTGSTIDRLDQSCYSIVVTSVAGVIAAKACSTRETV